MKNIILISAAALLWAGMAGCSDDRSAMGGEGAVRLSTSISTAVADASVISRASSTADELSESCIVWISNSRGAVRKFNGLGSVPASIPLLSGSYVAEAWAGDSVPASFTDRWFKAREAFTVTAGQTTPVNLTCRIANVVVSVSYADAIDEVLADYTMTVSSADGALTFTGRDDRKGYFMMSAGDKKLTYTIAGTQAGGQAYSQTGTIDNPVGGTEYKLTVNYSGLSGDDHNGGGYFTIEVDESAVDVEEEILIDMPPVIAGTDFDLGKTLYAEQGLVGRRSLFIASASAITSVKFASSLLRGDATYDFMALSDTEAATLHAAGLTWSSIAGADRSTVRINFEPELLDALPVGEYSATVSVTDAGGYTSDARFSLTVVAVGTMTPVSVEAVNDFDVWATRATVVGSVIGDAATNPGFRYRVKGAADWIDVTATHDAATASFTATLTELTPGMEYELTAFADEGSAANTVTFTTETAAQIPNSGFEDWDTSGKTTLVYPAGGEMFWDSGNHGSSTLRKNLTEPESSIKHSGNYSARLKSQYVGMLGIGKFAAGNIFTGQYLDTDMSTYNGTLGFGRPFASRPSAMRFWVKYVPAAANDKGSGSHLAKGEMDLGHVYVAVLDGSTESYQKDGDTYSYPVIVTTGDGGRLFDKSESKVIGYGERIFSDATAGDGLVEITIPIDYKRTDVKASNILIVCSASYYGDYFEGGEGSTMYVDDIELLYE